MDWKTPQAQTLIGDAIAHHEQLSSIAWPGSRESRRLGSLHELAAKSDLNMTVKVTQAGAVYSYRAIIKRGARSTSYSGRFSRDGVRGDVRLFKSLLREDAPSEHVPCPRCEDMMARQLIVCWPCAQQTDQLTTSEDAAHPVSVPLAARWTMARDERCKI